MSFILVLAAILAVVAFIWFLGMIATLRDARGESRKRKKPGGK